MVVALPYADLQFTKLPSNCGMMRLKSKLQGNAGMQSEIADTDRTIFVKRYRFWVQAASPLS
jgi:hypothetical protein